MTVNAFTLLCNHCYHPSLEPFSLPKLKTRYPFKQLSIPHSPQPLATTRRMYFLSLWIWLRWVPHINGIIQYLPCCDLLISLTMMPSWFKHVRTCHVSELLFWTISPGVNMPHFVYPLIHQGTLRWLSHFGPWK